MPSEAYHYRRLYEAAVEHIEALNQWAAERGIVLPDTDTAGSDVVGYAVVEQKPDEAQWGLVDEVYGDPADADAVLCDERSYRPHSRFAVAALVLLPEEA